MSLSVDYPETFLEYESTSLVMIVEVQEKEGK